MCAREFVRFLRRVESYNFADIDGDFQLKHFDNEVQHDQDCGMIEMVVKANNISRTEWPSEEDHGLRMMVSPWSPPPWMKAPTPDDDEGAEHAAEMTGSATPSCLREGTGKPSKYAETWALFFSKFITAYKKLGINTFAVTPQNEPDFPAPWDACATCPRWRMISLRITSAPSSIRRIPR